MGALSFVGEHHRLTCTALYTPPVTPALQEDDAVVSGLYAPPVTPYSKGNGGRRCGLSCTHRPSHLLCRRTMRLHQGYTHRPSHLTPKVMVDGGVDCLVHTARHIGPSRTLSESTISCFDRVQTNA